MATIKKMQKGGSTSKKKVDNSITGKIQRGVDYMLGSDKLRAAGVAANKAIKPYADKTRTAMNKTLAPIKPKSSMAKMQKGGSTTSPSKIKGQALKMWGDEKAMKGAILKDAAEKSKSQSLGINKQDTLFGDHAMMKLINQKYSAEAVKGKSGAQLKAEGLAKKKLGDKQKAVGQNLKKIGDARKAAGNKMKPTRYLKDGGGIMSKLRSKGQAIRKDGQDLKRAVTKRMQNGGVASGVNDIVTGSKKIGNSVARNLKPIAKTAAAIANPIGTGLYKVSGMAGKSADDMLQKRYPNYTGKGTAYSKAKSVAKTVLGYKKGGSKKK